MTNVVIVGADRGIGAAMANVYHRRGDAVVAVASLLLRAERSGKGNGRVYEVAFTATDGAGGNCEGTVSVCVPHDRRSSCVDDGQDFDSAP